MHRTITTWSDFRAAWDGARNFLMAGECVPFDFKPPPIERVVDELRANPEIRVSPGGKGDTLDLSDISEKFRAMPIDQAIRSPFGLACYRLGVFDEPGKFLHGFRERVLDPWQAALRSNGFTWTRCYPIIFITGPGSSTNYHMDFSHVLAWQIHGHKRFCGLRDPDQWAPREKRVRYTPNGFHRPAGIGEQDELCYEMGPGTVLWNALLTPHWVEAGGDAAMSVNISHGGLRLGGRLAPNEQELMDYIAAEPADAPELPVGGY